MYSTAEEIKKWEARIDDWKKDLKDNPNPIIDPMINKIIADMQDIIQDLREDDDESVNPIL